METPCSCRKCGHPLTAEIKPLLDKNRAYTEHTPVWYCKDCGFCYPAKKNEKLRWAKKFDWNKTKSFTRTCNYTGKTGRCLGCNREHVTASTEIVLPGYYFPVQTILAPVWECTDCGFRDLVSEEERYMWAEKYTNWR